MRWWYDTVAALCRSYYSRPEVAHPERLPRGGGVLYVGTHRNGAIDGCVYARVARRADFLIAAQLRRSFFGRLFFTGIEIVRDKDAGDRRGNAAALDACVARLAAGGRVFVLPEGTSDLGPRLLPIRPGAARIAAAALARGVPLAIVPLAVHYERAWAFRSRVHVVVGEPLAIADLRGADPGACTAALQARIVAALEALAVQFESAAEQQRAERLAQLAALGGHASYVAALRHFARGLAAPLRAADDALEREAVRHGGALRWRGVPLVGPARAVRDAGALALLGPLVALAALANSPPLLAAVWAARRFADAPNVVALWRVLVGLPALVLWAPAAATAAFAAHGPAASLAYVAGSAAGALAWPRVQRAFVALANAVARPDLAARVRRLDALFAAELARAPRA